MDYTAIGMRIRDARHQAHLTQAELSELADISVSYMGHIERGTRVMSLNTLFSLCSALHQSTDYILTGEAYKKPTF